MLIKCEECSQQISEGAFVCPKCGFRRFKPSLQEKNARRKIAENETKNDLTKIPSHLLDDIHDESLDRTRPDSETVARTMARFAALLIRLSKDGSETADKNLKIAETNLEVTNNNLKLQRRVLVLTWLIFIVTVLMFVISIIQYFDPRIDDSQGVQTYKTTNQTLQTAQP